MRKLFAVAAFLLVSTAAQAQYSFDYGGRTIRIDPDKGTVSIPGVYDNTGKRKKSSHTDQDVDRQHKPTPDQAKVDPQTPAAAPAKAEPVPAPANTNPPEPSTAAAAPADTITSVQPAASAPASPSVQDAAPADRPAPPPVVATAPVPPATQSATSPIGIWLTEEKEGKVRIEQCGTNLCGYSVDAKSNQNGDQVLINMRPGKDSKWSGRIFDPKSGSTYDSTIALKGPDSLRVQGCALGGMFCGGQSWTRVN